MPGLLLWHLKLSPWEGSRGWSQSTVCGPDSLLWAPWGLRGLELEGLHLGLVPGLLPGHAGVTALIG